MNKKIMSSLWFLFTVFIFTPSWAQDSTHTITDCIDMALANSQSLRINQQLVNKATLSFEDTKSTRLPKVGVGASYAYVSEFMKMQFPGTPPRTIDFGDGQNKELNLHIDAPIYTGGAMIAKESAKRFKIREAESFSQRDSLQLLHDVRTAWLNALAMRENLNSVVTNTRRLQRHLEQINKAIEVGMASANDRLQVEISLNRLSQKKLEAESAFTVACLNLGMTTGNSGSMTYPDGRLDVPIPGFQMFDFMADNLPSIKMINDQSGAVDEMKNAAKAALYPSVAAQAAYHYGKPGIDAVQNDWMNYFTVGINLNWTVWDWHSRNKNIQMVEADRRVVELQKKSISDMLTLQYTKAKEEYENALAIKKVTKLRLDLQKKNVENSEAIYKEHQISESEILDAYDDLDLIEVEYTMSLLKLRLAETAYLYSVGR